MVHRVVAHLVTFGFDSGKEFGMLDYIVAYAEKCCFDVVTLQDVEYFGRRFGARSVVEGKIYCMPSGFYSIFRWA